MRILFSLTLTASFLGLSVAPIAADDLEAAQQEPGDVEQTKQRSFWIGVMCHPISETLRAHLNVPDGQGLVVADAPQGSSAVTRLISRVRPSFIMRMSRMSQRYWP